MMKNLSVKKCTNSRNTKCDNFLTVTPIISTVHSFCKPFFYIRTIAVSKRKKVQKAVFSLLFLNWKYRYNEEGVCSEYFGGAEIEFSA